MDAGARTLTVLVTDIVGSTALFHGIGPEASDRVRNRHFELLSEAIRFDGGSVVKGLGDGLMATFRSARAAIDGGVRIQRALAQESASRRGPVPAARIGLATGDTTFDGGDVYGQAVVEAVRLCAAAGPAEVWVTEIALAVTGDAAKYTVERLGPTALKGLPDPIAVCRVGWQRQQLDAVRVVLADDAVLVREGVARLLEEEGINVVAQAGDAEELVRLVHNKRPDIVVTDLRMPPTRTEEGLDAAERIRRVAPGMSVVLLSQHLDTAYALRLAQGGASGIGYLLKERISDIAEFAGALRRVAAGGCALDPELVEALVADSAQLNALEGSHRHVISMVLEGCSDEELSARLGVDINAVTRAVTEALARLGLQAGPSDRVASVLGLPASAKRLQGTTVGEAVAAVVEPD